MLDPQQPVRCTETVPILKNKAGRMMRRLFYAQDLATAVRYTGGMVGYYDLAGNPYLVTRADIAYRVSPWDGRSVQRRATERLARLLATQPKAPALARFLNRLALVSYESTLVERGPVFAVGFAFPDMSSMTLEVDAPVAAWLTIAPDDLAQRTKH